MEDDLEMSYAQFPNATASDYCYEPGHGLNIHNTIYWNCSRICSDPELFFSSAATIEACLQIGPHYRTDP